MARGAPPGWRAANRANWDARTDVHLGPGNDMYDLAPLRAGRGLLHPIEEAEFLPVAGLRVLHLQCHFGYDTLALVQRGAAAAVGLDFSPKAVAAARELTAELGLAERARFVEADLYDAPQAVGEPAAFDRVFTTWGTIGWLPDIKGWARVVAHVLKPGGALYLADSHPAALVFDDGAGRDDAGRPGWFLPYFNPDVYVDAAPRDYTGDNPALGQGPEYEWQHTLADVVTALVEAGLRLRWLREHDAVPWPMFACLRKDPDRMYRWPDKPWLPLSFSLWAERAASA